MAIQSQGRVTQKVHRKLLTWACYDSMDGWQIKGKTLTTTVVTRKTVPRTTLDCVGHLRDLFNCGGHFEPSWERSVKVQNCSSWPLHPMMKSWNLSTCEPLCYSNLHHRHQNTKWGNVFWKNNVCSCKTLKCTEGVLVTGCDLMP